MKQASKSARAATKKTEPVDSVSSNTNIVVAPVEASSIPVANQTLTPAETKLLAKCEIIIGKGLKAFKEVANALQDVRDQNLYRIKYATFEEYCCVKWGFTARHANRLMLAGAVVDNIESDQLVSSVPAAIPENEAQARPLAALTPKQQVKAARSVASKTDEPTAKDFKEAASKVKGKAPKTAEPSVEDDAPRVESYVPSNDKTAAAQTNNSDLEKLMELVDEAQTQARRIKDCSDVVKMLGDVAKIVTRRLNGGVK